MYSCTQYNAYLTTEQVRQIGDQVIPSETVTEEIPEIDALFVAGLDQAVECIPTPSSIFSCLQANELAPVKIDRDRQRQQAKDIKRLEAELRRKEKALAETAALLVL